MADNATEKLNKHNPFRAGGSYCQLFEIMKKFEGDPVSRNKIINIAKKRIKKETRLLHYDLSILLSNTSHGIPHRSIRAKQDEYIIEKRFDGVFVFHLKVQA